MCHVSTDKDEVKEEFQASHHQSSVLSETINKLINIE